MRGLNKKKKKEKKKKKNAFPHLLLHYSVGHFDESFQIHCNNRIKL